LAEMRMVKWMCGIKLLDRVPSKGMRERLGLDDIILLLVWQQEWHPTCKKTEWWDAGVVICLG